MITTQIKVKGKIFDPNIREMLKEHWQENVRIGLTLILDEIIARAPHGATAAYISGLYIDSIQSTADGVEGRLKMQGSAVDYWDVVEYGRRAGSKMPPQGSLTTWLMTKFGYSYDEAKKREFGLRKSIAEDGIEGQHIVELASSFAEPTINELFSDFGV